ncbi:hypothetical protein HYQ46_009169 [Verticillium longisporum]|nr:hypothetical protein HYQ46_009169 [Verticillium longisporum]
MLERLTVSSMSLIKLTPLGSVILISWVAERFSFAKTRTCVGTNSRAALTMKWPASFVSTVLDAECSSL